MYLVNLRLDMIKIWLGILMGGLLISTQLLPLKCEATERQVGSTRGVQSERQFRC